MTERQVIERKLRNFEPREAVALALRATMRVFPALFYHEQVSTDPVDYSNNADQSRSVLALLRCYQVSTYGCSLHKVDSSVVSAASTAFVAIEDASAVAHVAAAYIAAAYVDASYADTAYVDAANAVVHAGSYLVPYGCAATYFAALDSDLTVFKPNRDVKALLSLPLWPDDIPDEIWSLWHQLKSDLRSLHGNYGIWIGWYEDRIWGQPIHWELERKWALLTDDILKQHPAEINGYLEMLRIGYLYKLENDETDGAAPDLPENQQPGFQYSQGEDGRIAQLRSGLASPDDAAEIAAMRGIILKAVDNLIAMTTGSNELGWVSFIASDYKDAITADGPPIDDIYGYGTWLENAYHGVKAQIDANPNDYPELAPNAVAAINTVIAIHGPMMATTARGQELMVRALTLPKHRLIRRHTSSKRKNLLM